jgi:hypothetical protein
MDEKNKKIIIIVSLLVLLGIVVFFLLRPDGSVKVDLTKSGADDASLPANVKISVQEESRNVTKSELTPTNIVIADPEDVIEVTITMFSDIPSGGARLLAKVVASPAASNVGGAGASYVPGSTTINGASVADGIMGAGLPLQTLAPTSTKITLRLKIEPKSNFPVGSSVLDVGMFITSTDTSLNLETTKTTRIIVKNELVQ